MLACHNFLFVLSPKPRGCSWHSASITCFRQWGRGVKRKWLLGRDETLDSVSVVSRLARCCDPTWENTGMKGEAGLWVLSVAGHSPGVLDTAPCQEQLPRIPAELIPGMELLRETLGDCACSQRFFNMFLNSCPVPATVSWWDTVVWVKWYLWPRQLPWRGHVIQIITAFHAA